MSDRLPKLSAAQMERLALLAEECAEVITAVTKIQRHGYESFDPTVENAPTNRWTLEYELGHLINAYDIMIAADDLNPQSVDASRNSKALTIQRWLHHQRMP